MSNITKIFKVFEQLQNVSKEKDKLAILSKISNLPETKKIAYIVESKDIKLNTSYNTLSKIKCGNKQIVTFQDFEQLVSKLSKGQITGKKKQLALEDFLSKCDTFHCKWYKRILSKDLRIGVGKSLLIKVLGLSEKDFGIIFKPMLATDLKSISQNQINKLFNDDIEWLAEIKIDGLRVITIFENNTFQCYSRNHKRLPLAEYVIAKGLTDKLISNLQGYALDGEFYSKNWSDSMSTLMRKTAIPKHIKFTDMTYYVFDFITVKGLQSGVYNVPYIQRKKRLLTLTKKFSHPIKIVKPIKVKKPYLTNLTNLSNKLIEQGWEGCVAKDITGIYEGKRSKHWIKFKKFMTIDVLCTGIIKSNKNPDEIAAITFRYKNGKECKCGSGFTQKQRKEFFKNPQSIVGKIVELKYQEESVDGCLRFPTFIGVRLDKDKPDVK